MSTSTLPIFAKFSGILNRQSRAERQSRTKLTVKLQIISAEHVCRVWLLLADSVCHTVYCWLASIDKTSSYSTSVTLVLSARNTKRQNTKLDHVTSCSQSKVFCRSALFCRFNIPKFLDLLVGWGGDTVPTGNENVPKITINNTIIYFF